ncbi:MAG: glycine--tRNA ligase subunit beta [Rickettsiaceae bacterium]|nr:glycine--tRNA ligase subunit beta [Rickettsiaceae bacterium]
MKDLLIEIYSEEIPALMQKNAEIGFYDIFRNFFTESKIEYSELECAVGPCRMVITAKLSELIPSSILEIKGPKIDGPKAAIEGFCIKNNCTIGDLSQKEVHGQVHYFYEKKIEALESIKIIQSNFEQIMKKYTWPKSMIWGDTNLSWTRPLRSILCFFGEEIIALKFAHLTSSNKTYKHKFMDAGQIEISSISDYFQQLENSHVIISREKRKNIILSSLKNECDKHGITLNEDESLLEEVAGLCEYPVILSGQIDQKFMALPEEVLITSLKSHQKYFTAKATSGIAPYFLFACNLKLDNYEKIIEGNKRVLSARLEDALYFFNNDSKKRLEENLIKLENVIYHKKLGTIRERVSRIEALTEMMDPSLVIAARLAKCDLVSEMVVEFPELQGIMGGYYAKINGHDEKISSAIKNHYKPAGLDDEAPTGPAAIISIADKMDGLISLFLAGERATGSGDPYGLRRYAIGIIRTIYQNNLDIDIRMMVGRGVELVQIEKDVDPITSIIAFLNERLRHFLKNSLPSEVINATINLNKLPNITKSINAAIALDQILQTEPGKNLLSLYKRAKNISTGISESGDQFSERGNLTESEKMLLNQISLTRDQLEEYTNKQDFLNGFQTLLKLEQPLAKFFEENLVNSDDEEVTFRRKSILLSAANLFEKIANFSLL